MTRKARKPAADAPRKWPVDEVSRRSVDDLVPYARNARKHSAKQVDKIAKSIVQFGWTSPVLCDEEGGIIAGHGRVMAAQKLGISEVPVMVARGWSDDQKRAYVIADNKLTIEGEWDDELLRVELEHLSESDFDPTLSGFDENEIASLLQQELTQTTTPQDTPDGPVSQLGDAWDLGAHTLNVGGSVGRDTTPDDLAVADRIISAWQEESGKTAILGETGETFAEVLARRWPGKVIGSRKAKRKSQSNG